MTIVLAAAQSVAQTVAHTHEVTINLKASHLTSRRVAKLFPGIPMGKPQRGR